MSLWLIKIWIKFSFKHSDWNLKTLFFLKLGFSPRYNNRTIIVTKFKGFCIGNFGKRIKREEFQIIHVLCTRKPQTISPIVILLSVSILGTLQLRRETIYNPFIIYNRTWVFLRLTINHVYYRAIIKYVEKHYDNSPHIHRTHGLSTPMTNLKSELKYFSLLVCSPPVACSRQSHSIVATYPTY